MKKTKKSIELHVIFKEDEKKKSDLAAAELLKIISSKKLTLENVRQKMFEKTGLKISEPTLLKWIHDPFFMNIYEMKAISEALNMNINDFINIVFNWVKIKTFSTIELRAE